MITIMARITARAGSEDELRQVLEHLLAPTRQEVGCVSYELFHNQDNPLDFVTVERWREQSAADAHLATQHVAAAIQRAGALMTAAPLIHRFQPVD